jgi:hypothetical protein
MEEDKELKKKAKEMIDGILSIMVGYADFRRCT